MTITSQRSTALADRYRIERHLGERGMATVYLAQDLKHDRKVALKVLRPELASPAEATTEAGSGDRRLVVLNWFEELKARVGR